MRSFAGISLLLSASLALAQDAPTFTPTAVTAPFIEQFSGEGLGRWSPSKAVKDEHLGEVFSYVGEWSVEEPTVFPGLAGDAGLVIKSKAAHHAISVPFATPLDPAGKTLVVQYEVKLQKGLDCGGAYIKLLTDSDIGIQAEEFSDKTPYTIMFGPDRCGSTSKVHFIFRHANPLTGEVEEKHLVAPPAPKITKTTALYTLIVRPDQTFEIKVNNESVKSGSLLTDFSPAVNPYKTIADVTDLKPEDWVESAKITDPAATKPEDWDESQPQVIEDAEAVVPATWLVDEPATVPDPDAIKPEEWSDEDDGDWIAPSIPNPKCEDAAGCGAWKRPEIANPLYKGAWFAPLIDNPAYKGVWAPRQIPNPDYFEDLTPANFNSMAGIGIELWSMTEDILFDNIYVGHSEEDAAAFAAETFEVKKPLEDALEAAEKPAPVSSADEPEPDYRTAPIAWVQYKAQEFANIAVLDPVAAIKQLPYSAATSGAVLATLIGMLSLVLTSLLSSPKPPAVKKVVVVKPVVVEAPVAEVPVVEKAEPTGVRTRAGKAAAAL